jgi:aryl-alcohol dehydrogenase (NADP+)
LERISDDILDCIDQIASPGVDIGLNEANYNPPALLNAGLRRRPIFDRAAA